MYYTESSVFSSHVLHRYSPSLFSTYYTVSARSDPFSGFFLTLSAINSSRSRTWEKLFGLLCLARLIDLAKNQPLMCHFKVRLPCWLFALPAIVDQRLFWQYQLHL